jgi:hypothetical protein
MLLRWLKIGSPWKNSGSRIAGTPLDRREGVFLVAKDDLPSEGIEGFL